jgi:hypothetical protein
MYLQENVEINLRNLDIMSTMQVYKSDIFRCYVGTYIHETHRMQDVQVFCSKSQIPNAVNGLSMCICVFSGLLKPLSRDAPFARSFHIAKIYKTIREEMKKK